PADATVLAAAAALVVMVHHSLPDAALDLARPRPDRGDDATRLVTGDHRLAAAAEPERCGLVAGGPVEFQIAAAHARGLDREQYLAGPGRGGGQLLDLDLAVPEKNHSAHDGPPVLRLERRRSRPRRAPARSGCPPPRAGASPRRSRASAPRRPPIRAWPPRPLAPSRRRSRSCTRSPSGGP